MSGQTASWKVSVNTQRFFSWEKTRRIVAELKTEQFRSKGRVGAFPAKVLPRHFTKRAARGVDCKCVVSCHFSCSAVCYCSCVSK